MDNNILICIVLCLLAATLVFMGILLFRYRNKIKLQQALTHKLLFSLEKDRERLAKELHDSFGQNVLFIRNQMIKNNQLELIPAVDEVIAGMRLMTNELYPSSLEKYGLIVAVDALVALVQEKTSLFISHDLEALDVNLSADQKINYYRIIEACISNTVKHAEASALRISAQKTAKGIGLTIQDNGKGFDKSILSKQTYGSSGILYLEARTKYLNGKLEIETSPGKGTKFIFHIPSLNE